MTKEVWFLVTREVVSGDSHHFNDGGTSESISTAAISYASVRKQPFKNSKDMLS
jgi:hypothetical protein